MTTMIPASPQTPRVPLASIVSIDSPVSMVSNSVPHSPFSSNYARRLSSSENELPLHPNSTSRRMSYTNFPSRRSSQRVSVGKINTIVEDQTPAQSAFDSLMQQAIIGSSSTHSVSSANTIMPFIDDNLPTPHTGATHRSRLSTTSSHLRTPMTSIGNSVPATPVSKLTGKSFSSALRTPLGQRSAADFNRLSPAAQRFIATSSKPSQQHHINSPHKLVNITQRQHSASVHPFPDHPSNHSLTKKFSIHNDENILVENMHNMSITSRNDHLSNMLLSPAPVITKQSPYHRTRPSLNSSAGLSISDAAMNVRKMR